MSNEFERLNAVKRFAHLDAGINKDLNELVDLIAKYGEVPVALISLIDDTMQWFKASVGTGDIVSNHRHLSFCNKTIEQNDMLIVPDATKDSRFENLPIVADEPGIKFYAGVPLVTYDGHSVGTVCILDVKPRELSDMQITLLKVLSKQALNLIELHWSLHTLSEQNLETLRQKKLIEESEIKLNAIFNSSKDLHLLIGKQYEVLAYNKATEIYVKKYHQKQIRKGAYILNFLTGAYHHDFIKCTRESLKGKHIKVEWLFEPNTPAERWLELSFIPVTDSNDEIIGTAVDAIDITQQKVNEHLIEQQNSAMQRIATIQSHELRKPIASLLGLVEVMKLEEVECDNYLEMIEKTVTELDDKVNHIIDEAEATIENTHV
jgi:PAS domain-containing protein